MEYVVGEILVWLLAALLLGGILAVLWMRLVTGARSDTRLAPLQDRIAELEGERDLLRREVGEARDRSTERETKLSALRDDLDARDAKIIGQAAEIERLREAGAAQPSPAASAADVEALMAEVAALRQRLAERDGQLAELNAELSNAREAYHHLEAAQFGVAPAAAEPEPRPGPASPAAAEPSGPAAEAEARDTTASRIPSEAPAPAAERPPVSSARPAGGDDLTKIKGIGKALESKLNALGVTSYSQIAAFSADDVARVGAQLTPKGRIVRDAWIDQARALLAEREASAG